MIDSHALIVVLLYKTVSMLTGLAFSFMGYQLFVKSITGQAGTFSISLGNHKLSLGNGAPGTFFVLFGTVIVSISLWKGLAISERAVTPPQAVVLQESTGQAVGTVVQSYHIDAVRSSPPTELKRCEPRLELKPVTNSVTGGKAQ